MVALKAQNIYAQMQKVKTQENGRTHLHQFDNICVAFRKNSAKCENRKHNQMHKRAAKNRKKNQVQKQIPD